MIFNIQSKIRPSDETSLREEDRDKIEDKISSSSLVLVFPIVKQKIKSLVCRSRRTNSTITSAMKILIYSHDFPLCV